LRGKESGMKILITSNNLEGRGGTESFVRTLARGLESVGHSVMAYSSDPGQGERLLENDVVPVATDLENLPFLPDVIHAQHHLDTMTALTALPGVPAVYHSHGAVWRACVVQHPRIYRYLAMSRTLAQRLVVESNISPDDIEVFLNGVELTRFTQVRNLPAQSKRALFFNSRHDAESDTLSAIREATSRNGLELDCIGLPFGRLTDEPEKVLPTYDIVFASGLSAIEALASGCTVVVLGRTSCGPMVQPENFDSLRGANFSIAANSPPPSVEKIEGELRRYSPQRSALVTARLREEADFSKSVSRLLDIYQCAIEQHRTRPPDPRGESLAISRYLRHIVPLIKMTDNMMGRNWSSASRASSFEELSARVALLEKEFKKTK
jgi:Glycosyltransferase Family 4